MSPTSAELRALAEQLITPELIVFPVRHHSPACAWQLRRLFASYRPSVVLVEGPRSFNALLPQLTDPAARMPLAIYTYAVREKAGGDGEQRRAAYYPFCDYSPELVAIREAHARGIATRFIDLEFTEQCQLSSEHDSEENASLLDEQHYRRSQYLQALAARLGCRDHEELWEHLFEVSAGMRPLHEHIARMTTYCQLARLDSSDEELRADGTLLREAEMTWHIRQALAERQPDQGPVVAVVGGFHAVALPSLLTAPPARPSFARGEVKDAASALIRYSFDRLDRLNGYAAGMTSPGWHQLLWQLMLKYDKVLQPESPEVRNSTALNVLMTLATELRGKHQLALPLPAVTAAYEQCLRLAQLRQRPAPVRDDVLDAVTSCFIKGDADADGVLVHAVARQVFTGTAMGVVPPSAAVPPLVKDFGYRARLQRLKIDDALPHRCALDIYRKPAHRLTSRLLHGLSLLGVPFAVRTGGPDFVAGLNLDRLQEHWEYSHSAATEAALVEASVYGVTLPLAVANRFVARLDKLQAAGESASARTAAALLNHACVLGLHDHLPRVITMLRQAIGQDAAFDSVTAAASCLGLLWESREPLEARDVQALPTLLQAAYERAMFLGRELRGNQCEPAAAVQALVQWRELLVSAAGGELDQTLYWDMIEFLHHEHDAALIRGAATGLCYGANRLDEEALATVVRGHLQGLAKASEAVAFLRGLLQTAREAAWQQPALLKVLDDLLAQWPDSDFIANLPELRLAFAEMTPKETDRIAAAVKALHGGRELGSLVNYEINAQDLQRHLELSHQLKALMRADGLAHWSET
ncbi:DUF5682 family protein [Permianibacter aggregans]|uniref:Uncharacterized protein n=1 Tax=Permianibacter aggregans TaxID=1510150 RepID=A0A4R6UAT8_9GAMM|nr:DUF5682 family protein [Permianibacter aggregans]QGX39858.1 hypothetical protein E2H98_09385 [Permianibacter aggregans]TDQ41825.1 hypothetical protein EV696_1385 [Permianibacter aggregans]